MFESGATDSLIHEFEREWASKGRPSIREYLARFGDIDQAQKHSLLVELICIDIEFRWKLFHVKKPKTKTIEDYAASLSWLGPASDVPIDLIQEEYRARQIWGDSPDHASYVRRFSERNGDLIRSLVLVDEELRCEHPTRQPSRHKSKTFEGDFTSHRHSGQPVSLEYRDYTLHQMIGAGQMGRVYRATKQPTGDQVAVKFLRKSFCGDEAAVDRFLREAATVCGLQHDGIVRVDGVGGTPGGGYFIVMEYLEGPDLASVVAQGPAAISDAVRWTIQAAKAVGYSNELGIVHCDLKPGNLVLDIRRHVRVTDFGLAIDVNERSASVDQIAGTAPYMAPEQICSWWGTIGPHTDAYALGAVLYSLLTGRAPYDGDTVTDVLSQVVSGAQAIAVDVLRPEMGADLAAVVTKALTKSTNDRYRSASDLAESLRAIDRSGQT